jgi:RHS repeat-associated protein
MATTVRYTTIKGELIAEKRAGIRSAYVPDPLGSTVALLDNTQAQTDTFTYWPYGEEKSRTGTTATPFRFVGTLGYYRDASVRTYVRARYLNTSLARWVTEDPIGFASKDSNIYRYCATNPMTATDKSGLAAKQDCEKSSRKPTGPIRVLAMVGPLQRQLPKPLPIPGLPWDLDDCVNRYCPADRDFWFRMCELEHAICLIRTPRGVNCDERRDRCCDEKVRDYRNCVSGCYQRTWVPHVCDPGAYPPWYNPLRGD